MDVKKFFSLDEAFLDGLEEHGSVKMRKYLSTAPATMTHAEYDRYELVEVAITQNPYFDGVREEKPVFKAAGVDCDGNEFEITWDVVENWEEVAEQGDDQQMVEDWDAPSKIEAI